VRYDENPQRCGFCGKAKAYQVKQVLLAVADVLLDMGINGETIPEPIACKHYSGKFMVRVPPAD
jgi:hypothetical protein